MKPATTEGGSLWRRVAWFVGIWAASITVLGAVAWVLRTILRP